jgi:hypothetical protein
MKITVLKWKRHSAGFEANRLHQIIYNPCAGGCYGGLEETHEPHWGAESTVRLPDGKINRQKYKIIENALRVSSKSYRGLPNHQEMP